MSTEKANKYGFTSIIDINEGVKITINWYVSNQNFQSNGYNVLNDEN